MMIGTLSPTGFRPNTVRVIAHSTVQSFPTSSPKWHLAVIAEPARRLQQPPLAASAASSTLAEREFTAAEQSIVVPELGLSRNFGARYKLMQPIGRGSFKTTYAAVDRATDLQVAVGVLAKERPGVAFEHNLHMIEQEVNE